MKSAFYVPLSIGCLILAGCGSDSSDSGVTSFPLHSEPLAYEQWPLLPDNTFYNQEGIAADAHVHAEKTLSKYSGKGVKVAVIDAALNAQHVELKGRVVAIEDAHSNGPYQGCDFASECDHGMAVTGIIASGINQQGLRGIAPESEIVFIHLALDGFVYDSDFINAFDIALKHDVDIVVCSWGTGDVSEIVAAKIEQLATQGRDGKGINIIFSAANNSAEMGNDESMLESVIGVGSSDESNQRSYYSSYGNGLDLVAPGGDLLGITTLHYRDQQYRSAIDSDAFNGTSASAPMVAGLVALMLQANPELTRQQVRSLLIRSADKIGDVTYNDGHNPFYGYGKVNFDASLELLQREKN
jgi:subtilisin family serine protease